MERDLSVSIPAVRAALARQEVKPLVFTLADMEKVEGVGRYPDLRRPLVCREIGVDDQQFVILLAQEGILPLRVEAGRTTENVAWELPSGPTCRGMTIRV